MDGMQTVYQVSLIAAFVAGMVALFAPCCISYLLPAYFGNVFKEKKHVIFMTFVYSLGIFVVMLPVVLGAKAIASFFYSLHDQVYYIGGIFMLVVALMALLGIKMPQPKLPWQPKKGSDIWSTFTLGIFSGITSSCCAPVLVGVITLSTFSPTILQSLGVGFAYVLGMVTPLYLASLFIDKRNILEKPIFRKQIGKVSIAGKVYPLIISNIIAAVVFTIAGGAMLILMSAGMIGMPSDHSPIVGTINNIAMLVDEITTSIPGLNLAFALIGAYLLYKLVKRAVGK
jgi:cytochrome c biogenesis protein CcdA